MVRWRLSAHKYRPPLVGFTPAGIRYHLPSPWSQVETAVRTQWALVCNEIEWKQWKLVKPRVTFDDKWQIVCSDVLKYQWNTKTCALWHLLKIEFLLSDVRKDLSCLSSSAYSSPVKNTNYDELTLFGVVSSSDSEVSSVLEGMVQELERNLMEVVDESFLEITKGSSFVDKDEFKKDFVTEVARTKQTALKDTGGLPVATRQSTMSSGGGGGGGIGGGAPGMSGGGSGKDPRVPIPAKPPMKQPSPGGKSP